MVLCVILIILTLDPLTFEDNIYQFVLRINGQNDNSWHLVTGKHSAQHCSMSWVRAVRLSF